MAPPEQPPCCLRLSSRSRARKVRPVSAERLPEREAAAGWTKAMSRCLRPASPSSSVCHQNRTDQLCFLTSQDQQEGKCLAREIPDIRCAP